MLSFGGLSRRQKNNFVLHCGLLSTFPSSIKGRFTLSFLHIPELWLHPIIPHDLLNCGNSVDNESLADWIFICYALVYKKHLSLSVSIFPLERPIASCFR